MRIFVSVPVVAFSIVVGLAAQAQQQPAAPAGEREQPAAARPPSKVTVGGCIQNAPAAPAAAQEAAAASRRFVLANVKQTGLAGAAASGTAAATRYRLEGEEKAVASHLNHQVEVTGIVQAAAASTAGAAGGAVLKVESVKMIADKCS